MHARVTHKTRVHRAVRRDGRRGPAVAPGGTGGRQEDGGRSGDAGQDRPQAQPAGLRLRHQHGPGPAEPWARRASTASSATPTTRASPTSTSPGPTGRTRCSGRPSRACRARSCSSSPRWAARPKNPAGGDRPAPQDLRHRLHRQPARPLHDHAELGQDRPVETHHGRHGRGQGQEMDPGQGRLLPQPARLAGGRARLDRRPPGARQPARRAHGYGGHEVLERREQCRRTSRPSWSRSSGCTRRATASSA